MIAVKGDQRDILNLVGVLLLHHANSLQGFVHASEGLLADALHGTALVNNNQVVNSRWNQISHSCKCFKGEYFLFFDMSLSL